MLLSGRRQNRGQYRQRKRSACVRSCRRCRLSRQPGRAMFVLPFAVSTLGMATKNPARPPAATNYVGRALLPVAFQTGKSAHPTENSRTLRRFEPLVARKATKKKELRRRFSRSQVFSCFFVFFVAMAIGNSWLTDTWNHMQANNP
jgi:hypothetical protein